VCNFPRQTRSEGGCTLYISDEGNMKCQRNWKNADWHVSGKKSLCHILITVCIATGKSRAKVKFLGNPYNREINVRWKMWKAKGKSSQSNWKEQIRTIKECKYDWNFNQLCEILFFICWTRYVKFCSFPQYIIMSF